MGNRALKNELKAELESLMDNTALHYEKDVWDRTFDKPISKEYKISICTTVMGRLHDLKVTLPKNIEDNKDYDNVEFVILDYNSQDGLGDWVKSEMEDHLSTGKVVYFRTEEPEFYSMTKSRNLAFKCATGDIVNNVDADSFTNEGFVSYLNKVANQKPERAIFAKGKKMLRGRLGFFKDDFINLLGGYDEAIEHYGHDDHDLMNRAWAQGFKLMWWGGEYYDCVEGHKKHQTENMKQPDWKLTEIQNKLISAKNIIAGKLKANEGKEWGKGTLIKNFNEEIIL